MFISKHVYIYLPTASTQVGLQHLVVSTSLLEKLQCPLFHYQILQCWLFIITKFCSVRLPLQEFVVCAFSLPNFVVSTFHHYKSLQCPLFIITKFCSVRFLSLQKFAVCAFSLPNFVVSAFYHYKKLQKFVVCAFSLQKFVVSTLCHYKSLQSAFLTCSLQCPGPCIGLGDMVKGLSFTLLMAIL